MKKVSTGEKIIIIGACAINGGCISAFAGLSLINAAATGLLMAALSVCIVGLVRAYTHV